MNSYKYIDYKGEPCVEFLSNGKYAEKVVVDKRTWDDYLNKFNWTIGNSHGYLTVHTNVNKLTVKLYRMIVEKEYDELDFWGNTIDHINNNSLDNRLSNLQIYNSKLNATNQLSKNKGDDMHLIFPQQRKIGGETNIHGYKIHTNIFDEVKYKNFKTLEEAKIYRDNELIPYIEKRIEDMKKKTRDIEFERGLRDKLKFNEKDEVLEILRKYDTSI